MKKIIFVIILIIIIILAVITVIFLKRQKMNISVTKMTLKKSSLEEKIYFPSLSQDQQQIFYLGNEGTKIKKFNLTNQKTEILYPHETSNIIKAYWSPDKTKVILKNNQENTSTNHRLYDLQNKKITDLDPGIQFVLWAPDSKRIYYHYFNEETNLSQLRASNPDGSNEQKLLDLKYPLYEFIWLNNSKNIGFWSVPSDLGGTKLKSFNLSDKKETEIIADYRINEALASPDGAHIIYENFNSEKSQVSIAYIDSGGENNQDTGLNSTLNKVAWVNNEVFVIAVNEPGKPSDVFYMMNVNTGKKTLIQYDDLESKISAENIMPIDINNIYFTSNNYLYKLSK